MNRAQVIDVMRTTAEEVLHLDTSRLSEDASLEDDLEVDSLHLVEYVMALENRLGVALPDEELMDATTLRDVADLLAAKVAAR